MSQFDIAVIGICGSLIIFMMGVIWWQLNNRLKKVEEWKVDKGFCKTKGLLLDEKFLGIGQRITDMKDINTRDHEKLDDQLAQMRGTMEEIRDCMVKLAGQQKC